MKRSKHTLLAALIACLLVPLGNPVLADREAETPDTSNWVCKLCPISGGWIGEWDFGLIYVDDPTPKFADYRGLIDDGFYLEASGSTNYRAENGNYFDFYGRNLGLRSRALEMRGGKQGRYELRAHYSEIPRYLGHGTVTPYEGVGSDTLTLAEGWQSQAMEPARLRSKRQTYGAGLSVKFGGSWKFQVDAERQARDGTRTFGGGLFAISGALFPAPIDHTTDLINTGLEYNGNRGQLRFEFIGSDFENDNRSVTWDNPIATGWGDEVSRSALEPDNNYHQFSLVGAFRFSPRFRISGKAAMGRIKQDVPFLPYTINPAYGDLELPRESLDGKVDTSVYNLAGRLYWRVLDRLDLTAAYKYDERDNKTPVDTYTPVLFEVLPSSPRSNRPYSFDRSQARVELRYRPVNKVRLNAGWKRYAVKRTYQEIRKSEEDALWGEVQFMPRAWLDGRFKYEHLDRDTSDHEQQGNYDRAENPLMRKYNMADRERNRGTIEFDLYPTERFGISLSYYTTEDEYKESVIGLTEGEESSINLDLNYSLGKHTTMYGFVTRDKIESELSGAHATGAIPWNAFTRDEILTWGVGVNGRINDKLSCGLDYVYSKADGDILTDSGAGEAPFPVLTTKLRNTRVYLDYKLNDRWGLGLDAYREKYDSSDWYIDGFGPTDVSGVLTMGEVSPDYKASVIRLLATLNF
jgi:MtrB/PioB family decaheme-associated outer membrane protein